VARLNRIEAEPAPHMDGDIVAEIYAKIPGLLPGLRQTNKK